MPDYDVITVGGGLGGSALAKVLAEKGLRVLVTEREVEFKDRIRGETMAPWGVAEAQKLGTIRSPARKLRSRAAQRARTGSPPRDFRSTTPQGLPGAEFLSSSDAGDSPGNGETCWGRGAARSQRSPGEAGAVSDRDGRGGQYRPRSHRKGGCLRGRQKLDGPELGRLSDPSWQTTTVRRRRDVRGNANTRRHRRNSLQSPIAARGLPLSPRRRTCSRVSCICTGNS